MLDFLLNIKLNAISFFFLFYAGCAFVTFVSKAQALAAIKKMHQSTIMENCSGPLVVKFADTQRHKEQRNKEQRKQQIIMQQIATSPNSNAPANFLSLTGSNLHQSPFLSTANNLQKTAQTALNTNPYLNLALNSVATNTGQTTNEIHHSLFTAVAAAHQVNHSTHPNHTQPLVNVLSLQQKQIVGGQVDHLGTINTALTANPPLLTATSSVPIFQSKQILHKHNFNGSNLYQSGKHSYTQQRLNSANTNSNIKQAKIDLNSNGNGNESKVETEDKSNKVKSLEEVDKDQLNKTDENNDDKSFNNNDVTTTSFIDSPNNNDNNISKQQISTDNDQQQDQLLESEISTTNELIKSEKEKDTNTESINNESDPNQSLKVNKVNDIVNINNKINNKSNLKSSRRNTINHYSHLANRVLLSNAQSINSFPINYSSPAAYYTSNPPFLTTSTTSLLPTHAILHHQHPITASSFQAPYQTQNLNPQLTTNHSTLIHSNTGQLIPIAQPFSSLSSNNLLTTHTAAYPSSHYLNTDHLIHHNIHQTATSILQPQTPHGQILNSKNSLITNNSKQIEGPDGSNL